MDEEILADRRSVVVRWLGPAGFAVALLLFLFLPVASVSCGSNDNGPAHLCYSGSQFLSGHPAVTLVGVVGADDLGALLGATVDLPEAARVLAIAVVVALGAGVLTGLLRRPTARAVAMTVAALLGAILLGVTELVALPGLAARADFVTGLFVYPSDTALGTSDIVGTAVGFWSTLGILVVVATAGVRRLVDRREERESPPGRRLFD